MFSREIWCIITDNIPIGFFDDKLNAQDALSLYVKSGYVARWCR